MFDLVGVVNRKIAAALDTALVSVIAGAAAVAALMFLSIALFIWLTECCSALAACLAIGGLCLTLAAASAIAVAMSARRRARVPRLPAGTRYHGPPVAETVREIAREASEQFKAMARRLPLATLGLAVGVGFIYGASRRR